jgi:hypothetical protein
VLRPAKRPKGREIAAHLRRLIREIRSHWPRVEILLRGDGHYCAPEVLDLCRAGRGLHPRPADHQRAAPPCGDAGGSTTARAAAADGGTVRRFKEFHDGAASWSRVERIIARVEAGPRGCDTRFVVTSLTKGHRQGALRAALLRPRPGREPHQGLEGPPRRRPHLLHQRHRQPAPPVPARRRLLADVDPARRAAEALALARAQFDTLRLRLIKIAARVVEMKTRITVHLPSACPMSCCPWLCSAAHATGAGAPGPPFASTSRSTW